MYGIIIWYNNYFLIIYIQKNYIIYIIYIHLQFQMQILFNHCLNIYFENIFILFIIQKKKKNNDELSKKSEFVTRCYYLNPN